MQSGLGDTLNMLQMLVANAEALVSSGYYDMPPTHHQGRRPSFKGALTESPSFPIIAEVKMASPGRPIISLHSPGDLIALYSKGGATALSVLTEPNHFHGSLSLLGAASRTGLPTLMKDIVVSMDQVEAGARLGAGAVLLIEHLSRLGTTRLDIDGLIEGAHGLGLEVLLEVSNEEEMIRGLRRDADVIGINQRDLGDMTVDSSKGQRMLGEFAAAARSPIIVMSGIEGAKHVAALRDLGASGALVGTALASSLDPAKAIKDLKVGR